MNARKTKLTEELSTVIDNELSTPVSNAARAMSESLLARYGDSVLGIVYYGSCFRTGTEEDGILDIFIIWHVRYHTHQQTILNTHSFLALLSSGCMPLRLGQHWLHYHTSLRQYRYLLSF